MTEVRHWRSRNLKVSADPKDFKVRLGNILQLVSDGCTIAAHG
eukprot:CAMPEP_0115474314 /NCGR_PEP_ID=MMETSP0271-20121206/54030_1 /TAXON_ID=71861 /ORGANISM="Scrippsiella trochoidea, Strain CCMP3099" /LENGTH=42 /DNA_ID= /DNA_START= /DNA_END= /DNA_ORIENTATION=